MFYFEKKLHTKSMKMLLLCLEVFFARILDVSIGSIRTVYLIKQKNLIACVLAFIELIIWFYVARETLTRSDISLIVVISYALGYAVGTYIGGLINKYFITGSLMVLIFASTNFLKLKQALKKQGYGASTLNMSNQKKLLLIEIKKKDLKKLKKIVQSYDKKAFVIVNETLEVHNGYF